ncbi:MAG: aminotransferase class I/II-fold pyridoxal phosphate-dependent enzyme [Gammaproteobacteria bacterium]|nr:aminotransferase class I/II-fold pyridoxal phosphate-dependent enzyme [Gammaproteobacteria bacterium]
MKLLDKFTATTAIRDALQRDGVSPTAIVIDQILSPTEALINGRRTLLVGTNNYLGLTFDPDCIEAGRTALTRSGTGTTGSRMANGTYLEHCLLEQELAAFFGYPHGMVFSTGYAANLGCLAALLGPGDAVLLDGDAHASLYDGCRMTGAEIYRFKHNDADSLRKRMRRLGAQANRTLIVVEGLYSVLGDIAPLADFASVRDEFGACLFVDEAHSFGVFGNKGGGLAEQLGLLDRVDFIVGTFSKSLGSIGGFCVSRHDELPLFRYASRPYIFTASPCPSVIATTRAALRQIGARPQLRTQLWRNAQRLHEGLTAQGFTLGAAASPVIAVRMGERDAALHFWQRLLAAGVYTNLMLPPATPDGGSLVRCSVTAAHTDAQIDTVLQAFRAAAAQSVTATS